MLINIKSNCTTSSRFDVLYFPLGAFLVHGTLGVSYSLLFTGFTVLVSSTEEQHVFAALELPNLNYAHGQN